MYLYSVLLKKSLLFDLSVVICRVNCVTENKCVTPFYFLRKMDMNIYRGQILRQMLEVSLFYLLFFAQW